MAARHVRFEVVSHHRGDDVPGLAEVRFSNAEEKAPAPGTAAWQPKYPRPQHPKVKVGEALAGEANYSYPAGAGVVDVTKGPYSARGDGVADDTAAIQKALDDHPNKGAIISLPNGVYLVSRTLRWPHGGGGGAEEKNTVPHGQSRRGTVIKLKDACAGLEDPRRPAGVVWTGKAPAQRFGNEIHHLTIDTGVDNPGACGLQFIANNQGGVCDVTIVSGDGQGVVGLDLGYTDEQGPCLVRDVKVVGFDLGVHTATAVASEVLENVTVEGQNKAGLRNDGQPCTVRGLRSVNEVTAVVAGGGQTVVVDAVLEGRGAASKEAAVVNEASVVLRKVWTRGYRVAVSDRGGQKREVEGPDVEHYLSRPAVSLFGEPGAGLRLPARETPEVPWDDPAVWVAPQKFGAKADDGRDDSDALQKAIDSGATTVYLPRGTYHVGKTVVVRGNVRRVIGCKACLVPVEPLKSRAEAVLRVEDGREPVVVVEGLTTDFSGGPYVFLENVRMRTLVMNRLMINFQAARAYEGRGPGAVFFQDVVGRGFTFQGQKVWGRQFNPEGDGTHVVNDGGTLWVLGFKTEGKGTLIATKNGGKTEVVGGLSYTVGDKTLNEPMFVVEDSEASISFVEVCFSGDPFRRIVREVRRGEAREMRNTDPKWRGGFTLYTSGK